MKVELIGITHPQIDGLESASDLVSYCARVSNPSNQLNVHTSSGLLKYCIKHKHFSIFEMVNVVIGIETTRDISRQILRHRSFSFQEFSQRYSEVDATPILRETRLQDTKNKQNSLQNTDEFLDNVFNSMQEYVFKNSYTAYKDALGRGIAKEQARALLPEGLVKTNMYMNGSLRSWITYLQVRCGVETQKEHRDIAKAIAVMLFEEFPFLKDVIGEVIEDNYSAEIL